MISLEQESTTILIAVPEGVPRELVANYLERCRAGLPALKAAICENRHAEARVLGHRMKGTGAPYGFSWLTEIGAQIERAATDQNNAALHEYFAALVEYLGRVEILSD